ARPIWRNRSEALVVNLADASILTHHQLAGAFVNPQLPGRESVGARCHYHHREVPTTHGRLPVWYGATSRLCFRDPPVSAITGCVRSPSADLFARSPQSGSNISPGRGKPRQVFPARPSGNASSGRPAGRRAPFATTTASGSGPRSAAAADRKRSHRQTISASKAASVGSILLVPSRSRRPMPTCPPTVVRNSSTIRTPTMTPRRSGLGRNDPLAGTVCTIRSPRLAVAPRPGGKERRRRLP